MLNGDLLTETVSQPEGPATAKRVTAAPARPRRLPTPAGSLLRGVLRRGLGRSRVALAGLAADWPWMMTEGPASRTRPVKLSFPKGQGTGGVLTLEADRADALALEHDTARILERVNRFYGHAAVARVRITQTDRPAAAAPRRLAPSAEQRRWIETTVAPIADPELQARLAGLAEGILARNTDP